MSCINEKERWHISGMLTALSVIVIALSFSVLPFVFGFDIHADIFGNLGEIKFKVFSITVFKASLSIESKSVTEKNIVIKSEKKRKEIHLNTDKDDKDSVMSLFKTVPIMSYIRMSRLSVGIELGFASDAFYTTMSVGSLRILFRAVAAFLKSRQNIRIEENVVPKYNRNELDISVVGIFKLSLANIINGFIGGLLNRWGVRAARNGKKRNRKFVIKTVRSEI